MSVSIPYRPGFIEGSRAWLVYTWHFRRRSVVWLVVFVLLDALLLLNGYSGWQVTLSVALCIVVPAIGLLFPLAFRLLWAYKIRQLGIYELLVEDEGFFVTGSGIRVGGPWDGY
jgi:hypothetical protein